jgi:hypothetical protein
MHGPAQTPARKLRAQLRIQKRLREQAFPFVPPECIPSAHLLCSMTQLPGKPDAVVGKTAVQCICIDPAFVLH